MDCSRISQLPNLSRFCSLNSDNKLFWIIFIYLQEKSRYIS